MTGLADRRTALRRQLRERRASLADGERHAAAVAVMSRLEELPILNRAAVVAGYRATRGEVDIDTTLIRLGERGAVVTVPRVVGERMEFIPWSPATESTIGSFGIEEPRDGAPVPFERHVVVLTPLVAFDRTGKRLGQGGGFYDRMMGQIGASRPLMIGIAYGFQEVEQVPVEPWDQQLDAVVTPHELIDCRGSLSDLSGQDPHSAR